jgi:hypothetical protein
MGLVSHLVHFDPGKELWYPLCRRMGGPRVWFTLVQEISSTPGLLALSLYCVRISVS